MWRHWQEELETDSRDEELLPETAKTLKMYAAFCEYMAVLERARSVMDVASFRMPFLETEKAFAAIEQNDDSERFSEAAIRFLDLFTELHSEDMGTVPDEMDAEMFLQLATSAAGAELTDYLQESGRTAGLDSDADAFPMLSSVLSREDIQLLASVSQPAYSSFLVTALEAFSVSQTLLPYVASAAVFALTLLFILQRLTASRLHSLEEISRQTGWDFPVFTALPEGFTPAAGSLEYQEELWGRPVLTMMLERGQDTLLVQMSRPNRKWEMDECDLHASETVEESPERLIRARLPEKNGSVDVQVDLGPWQVRIQSADGKAARNEALESARALHLSLK